MKRRRHLSDEPLPRGCDWVEWGGERILAMGYTEGGAPFGLSVEEFRMASEQDHPGAGWVRAKRLLWHALEQWAGPGSRADVGRVKKVGEGLSREIFAADVDVVSPTGRHAGIYAALIPRGGTDAGLDRRVPAELRLLARLGDLALPFRVPAAIGACPDAGRLALVREFIQGVPLDLRAGRQGGVRPWQIVGEIAAAVHAIDRNVLADVVTGPATRREHAEASLEVFDGLEGSEVDDARAWATEHCLLSSEQSVLIHGDLLGQNILLWPDEPPALIDWEFAELGDPAYDLAIVTRGVRRPFQIDHGLDRLLDAYAAAGGTAVTASQIRLHELCLAAAWYRDALAGADGAEPPDTALARFRGVMRRAASTPGSAR